MNDNDCNDMSSSNCDEAMERLYEYLDKELDNATAEGIRNHLDDCGGCHNSFEFERKLKKVVRERLSEEVPDRFLIELRKAIDHEAAKS